MNKILGWASQAINYANEVVGEAVSIVTEVTTEVATATVSAITTGPAALIESVVGPNSTSVSLRELNTITTPHVQTAVGVAGRIVHCVAASPGRTASQVITGVQEVGNYLDGDDSAGARAAANLGAAAFKFFVGGLVLEAAADLAAPLLDNGIERTIELVASTFSDAATDTAVSAADAVNSFADGTAGRVLFGDAPNPNLYLEMHTPSISVPLVQVGPDIDLPEPPFNASPTRLIVDEETLEWNMGTWHDSLGQVRNNIRNPFSPGVQ